MGLHRCRWEWIGVLRLENGWGKTLSGHMTLTRDGVIVSQFLPGLSFQNQEIQILLCFSGFRSLYSLQKGRLQSHLNLQFSPPTTHHNIHHYFINFSEEENAPSSNYNAYRFHPYLLRLGVQADFIHDSGPWTCEADLETRVQADFRPGIVTVDGHADDWKDVDGFEFSLLPALDPDQEKAYTGGKMIVKALHDGKDVFFILQVDGNYVYSKGDNNKCPSVALMSQAGENASYHNMGGCKESPDTCNSKTCKGYEVDIMHFSIGKAIPGKALWRQSSRQ